MILNTISANIKVLNILVLVSTIYNVVKDKYNCIK